MPRRQPRRSSLRRPVVSRRRRPSAERCGFESLESRIAMAADVATVAQPPALLPKIHVSHFGQDISFTSRAMFQSWADDYISFLSNSGATVAYINIGDYLQDQKNAYSYLKPSLGTNNVPWIVTDFLDKLPAGLEAGVIAYLDVANPWTVYDSNNTATNVSTTDAGPNSPPKNNVYQAFQMVNAINAAQLQSGGTKFFTHFQADGEGAGAFESDSYYGFGATPDKGTAYDSNGNVPVAPTTWSASDFPTAGYGYIKWLWNHFMPGVTADDVAPGGVALPKSVTVPDVVFTDAEAIVSTTWPAGRGYQFGIIKYAQTSWLNYSPGPMLAYTENYWFGENHYMPGPGSAIAPDGTATINYVQTPVLNPPSVANSFPNGTPTVTFNQPVDANNNPIVGATAAQGYAVMGTGAIDTTLFGSYTHAFFGGSGVGRGYSTGAWVNVGGSGYQKGSPNDLNVTFTAPSDPAGRVATGFIDSVDSNGAVLSITITDPGAGYGETEPRISFAGPGTGAQAVALVTAANGYPTIAFPTTGSKQAQGYVTVSPQGYKPGSITGVVIKDSGAGYPYAPIDTTVASPLAGPGGMPVTFSSTFAPAQYLNDMGVTATQAAGSIYFPVSSSPSQVAQIVITVLGDHYDSGVNKPYYTLSGDSTATKHYLTGGAAKNGVNVDYNSAYVSPLNLAGSFFVDDAGVSGVTVIQPGMGYSAGAVIEAGGGGYDKSTVYPVTFPAPAASGGRMAQGFLTIDANGVAIGVTVTDPGSGYVAADDGVSFQLPNPGGTGSAGTAKAYLSNYPTASIAQGQFGPDGGTPARAFVITGPTDPKNPTQSDPQHGYIVTGVGFIYPGVGYTAVPGITIPQSTAPNSVQAVVQALPALASKYSAGQLPTIKDVLGTPQAAIRGGANAYNWQVSNGYGPGQVTGVTQLVGGSGYTSVPTVTVSAPPTGGRQAQAQATVSGGAVTAITITDAGYGYDPANLPTVAFTGGGGTGASATATLGDVMVMSKAAVNTVYDFYKEQPELLAAMFDEERYQDVALPKLREAFYWPLQWTSFNTTNSTDGTKTPQQAIATFSIESLNRSNAFDANGTYIPNGVVRTSLDSKYQPEDALKAPNTLGGTFAGLSSLSYENFVTFLNTAATIIAGKAPKNADGTPTMRPQDVTFQVYDAAFLPVEWLTAQSANRWGSQNEAPVLVSGGSATVPENAPTSRIVYAAQATDIGATVADRTLTYSLKPGLSDDAALVTIDPRYGEVRLRASANFEAKSSYAFTVVVSDGGSPALTTELPVIVAVADLLEGPAAPQVAAPAAFSIVEDTATKLLFTGTPFTDADSSVSKRMTVTLQAPGRIVAAPALGVAVGGTPGNRTFTGSLSALNAYFTDPRGQLTYVPPADAAADALLTIRIRETDGGRTLQSVGATLLRMVPVNDAPRLRLAAAPLVARAEQPSLLRFAAAERGVIDVDSPHVSVVVTVPAGTLQAAPAAGVSVSGSPSARLDFAGSPAALSAYFARLGQVRFTTAPGQTGPQTLRLTVDDGVDARTYAKAIRIVSAPRLPQIAAVAAFQAVRGVAAPLVFSGTPFANPDAAREPGLRLSVTLSVAEGAVRAGSGQGVTVGGTARARTFSGTLAALNAYFTDTAGRITYLANPLVSGPRPLGITLAKRVSDAAGVERVLQATAWSRIDVA
jgi:hypothetical protein